MSSTFLLTVVLCANGQTTSGGDASPTPPTTPAAAVTETRDADTGAWLVELARHQGHLVGRTSFRSAALHALALLQSAVRVAPDNAEAHALCYDLLGRLGREDAARTALGEYVRLAPDDDAARIRHLELEFADRQTAEARADLMRFELRQPPLSRVYESELRCRLAKFHFERRQNVPAEREIERALRLNPTNVGARELAYEMFGETEPTLQRIELALQLLTANPSQINLIWELGELLDHLSLHAQAQEWYHRATELHAAAGAGPAPPVYLRKLAVSYADAGDFDEALKAVDDAIAGDKEHHPTRLLRAHILHRLGRESDADAELDAVAAAYDARVPDVVKNRLGDEAADIAWFYCFHRPDKDRSLELAQVAMDRAADSSRARLAFGWALRLNGRTSEAIKVLEPSASVDQLAALELARAYLDEGQRPRALTVLHKAATLQYTGAASELISQLLIAEGEKPPSAPERTPIVNALKRFDRRVFDFVKRPGDFLRFTAAFAADPLPAVGPVRVRLRLENTGPFAITLGEGFMARPLAVVTAELIGDGQAGHSTSTAGDSRSTTQLQVLMNARLVLPPGDAVEKTVAIDVGPLREGLRRSITADRRVRVTALFDPVYARGELCAGLGTVAAAPIEAVRPAIGDSPEAITLLLQQSASKSAAVRTAAADAIGAVLASRAGEDGDAGVGELDVRSLRTALETLLSDSDWRVRAHAVVAAGWAGLDDAMTVAAAPSVRDDNAVVRLLAIRLFAEHQGEKFRKVLEEFSRRDPDATVRMLAQSYVRDTLGPSASAGPDDATAP